jgi:hypothetical protein
MLPYIIAGAIGFVVGKLFEDDKAPKYDGGGSVLLAPNGKPSKLTPEQYKLVRTPEFKAWFGDWENSPENSSKVIDENGEPLVVYHGTDSKFNIFDKKYIGSKTYLTSLNGFHFAKDKNIANRYGIKIKSFFIGKGKLLFNGGKMVVTDNPNQIKLADGTNTTFDGNNPDIRFKRGGKVLGYDDVIKKQQIDNPYSDVLFSNKNSKFIEETIDIKQLRELNGFSDDEDEIEQTISYFNDLGMDEDYAVGRKLMNKIVDGVELSPIVVDEEYKVLDGSHRLSAYSELYYYFGYDYPFDGKLKIYKRISN